MAIKKQVIKTKPVVIVTFSIEAKEANAAAVVGDFNNWNPGLRQHRAGGFGMFQPGDDHARWPPRQHFVNHRLFAFGRIMRDPDDGLQAGVFQRLGNARHHLGEDHVRQRRDDHRNKVNALAGKRARDLVRHIAKLARRF